jgi:hypothetical protein
MKLRTNVGGTAAVQGGAFASKIFLSVALIGSAAGIAGLGTYATFTSSTPAESQVLASGTASIELGATGTAGNRLDVGASGVLPGDTVQRAVDLTNSGDAALAAVSLTTSASPSSKLDTDTVKGLRMTVDSCSGPWTESGQQPYTYSCPGTTSAVVASRPVIGSNLDLGNLAVLAPSGTDHLRVTLALPQTADDTFEGLSSTVGFVFTGTQRAATSK